MSLSRELRALQAELPQALEVVRVPAVLVDAAGRIRWLNAAGIVLFGDLRGRRYTELVAPEDAGMAQEAFARKILGAPSTDYRARILAASGETIVAEVSSVGLRSGESVVGVFGLFKPVGGEPRSRSSRFGNLTPRQSEVLRHLGEGYATRDIASEMGISEETVRNHVRGVLKVLRAHSRLEAVAIAHADGLLD